jgi:shikimate kinase
VIAVVGFMGAGKSTVGRLLAAALDLSFVDSDDAIELEAGMPVPEIFARLGEPAFRDLEHRVVADLLGGPDRIVALGGGAVEDPRTRSLLAQRCTVYLEVSYARALSRVGDDAGRPVLASPDVAQRYERRLAGYREVATVTVDTDGRSPLETADAVLRRLGGSPGPASVR